MMYHSKLISFFLIFFIVCVPSLNSVITYDGHLYAELVNKIRNGTLDHWDWVRTPLFPASLAAFETLLGRNAETFVWLNTIYISVALLLANLIAAKAELRGLPRALALCVFASPAVIAYQNTLLMEAALTMMLLILSVVLVSQWSSLSQKYTVLVIALVVAYYLKPSFLYLAPAMFVLALVPTNSPRVDEIASASLSEQLARELKYAVAALFCFVLIIAPWEMQLRNSGRMSAVSTFFPLMVGAVPADERLLGDQALYYQRLVSDGVPRGGLPHDKIYPMMDKIPPGNLLSASFWTSPRTYFAAVVMTLGVYVAPPSASSETQGYFAAAIGKNGEDRTKIYSGPTSLTGMVQHDYGAGYKTGYFAIFLGWIGRLLSWFTSLCLAALPISFAVGFVLRDRMLIMVSGLAISYLAMHALALMAIDRYAAPAVPLAAITFVLAFSHLTKLMPKHDVRL